MTRFSENQSPRVFALIAEQNPGRCAVCDHQLKPGSRRFGGKSRLCGEKNCRRVYMLAVAGDSKHRMRAKAKGVDL